MAFLARVASLIRNLTGRSRVERELDDELRATVEMLAAEKMRCRSRARRRTPRGPAELGGVEADQGTGPRCAVRCEARHARSGRSLRRAAAAPQSALRLDRRTVAGRRHRRQHRGLHDRQQPAAFLARWRSASRIASSTSVGVFDGMPLGFNPISYPDYLDIRRRTTTLEHVYAHPLFTREHDARQHDGHRDRRQPTSSPRTTSRRSARARPLGRLFLARRRAISRAPARSSSSVIGSGCAVSTPILPSSDRRSG